MNLHEFYNTIGGNYEDVLRRLQNEGRILKFLSKFSQDSSFDQLSCAMRQGDCQTAFRAAHSMKGICMNLGLTRLQESSGNLTENLRGEKVDDKTPALFEKIVQDYNQTCAFLVELLN